MHTLRWRSTPATASPSRRSSAATAPPTDPASELRQHRSRPRRPPGLHLRPHRRKGRPLSADPARAMRLRQGPPLRVMSKEGLDRLVAHLQPSPATHRTRRKTPITHVTNVLGRNSQDVRGVASATFRILVQLGSRRGGLLHWPRETSGRSPAPSTGPALPRGVRSARQPQGSCSKGAWIRCTWVASPSAAGRGRISCQVGRLGRGDGRRT